MQKLRDYCYYLYIFGLLLLAAALPLSNYLMSVAQFVLVGAWIIDGCYRDKLSRFWSNKAAVLFCSIYLLHLFGLIYTTDFDYALKDLRIKLPILIIPFIVASSRSLKEKNISLILWIFILAVLVGSVVNTLISYGVFEGYTVRYRSSVFISHIRFSLMICLAIFSLLYLGIKGKQIWLKVIAVLLIGWLTFFLFFLKALTGISAFVVAGIGILIFFGVKSSRKQLRYALPIFALTAVISIVIYGYVQFKAFYDIKDNLNNLEQFSKNGERYSNNLKNKQLENGHYVWIYVAKGELEYAWRKRSKINFWGKDAKGQPVYATLIRFLASKGLRRDMEGVNQLSEKEIKAIEQGITNVRFIDSKSFNDRVYEIIWEYNNYKTGNSPQGSSIFQRLEYWKTGLDIFKQHPLLGVGTGDVSRAFKAQYKIEATPLSKKYRLRTHNQYLTILLTFGILGFIWFMLAMLYPLFYPKKFLSYHYLVFIIIALISFLSDDTLETQAGVTFIVFFNALFLFGKNLEAPDKSFDI